MRLGGPDDPRRANNRAPAGQGYAPAVAPEVRKQIGLFALGTLLVAVLAGLLLGLGGVEVTEYALNSSLLTRKVEKKTYQSGRYWIGPFNYFIKFPAIVKTIQFSESKLQTDLPFSERSDGLLRSRTKDGLDVSIELSFQYQLLKDKIYDLYTTLGPGLEFHTVYVRIAIDRLTEIATTFTANEFFVERTTIGHKMEAHLKKDFEEMLYATIFSFQLRSVSLPKEFEDAIQETEVMKQDVKVATMEQQSTKVGLETQLMQAKRRVNVATAQADAKAQATLLANAADITQFKAVQEKSAEGYAGVLKELDANADDMLGYMEAKVMREHPSDRVTVALGMPNPTSVV